MKNRLLLTCMLVSSLVLGQEKPKLSVDIKKMESIKDSISIYSISVANYSDSIVCILHSFYILLSIGNVGSKPQALALYNSDKSSEFFTLKHAVRDTIYILDVPQYRATNILPYQSINFKILIPYSSKKQSFELDYFYLYDLSYRKFQKETTKGKWEEKYKRVKKIMELPK